MTIPQPKNEILLDTRGLPPPEPLELVLEALSNLQQHQCLRMLVDREPRPLYTILDGNNFHYETTTSADYRYELLIWHKS
ncbi:hypothetical protein CR155_12570 [Pollutimonas nitritireducens]|uniref:DUF2249 domain-containing protein n=1 Tax=Pollutimonas nitritireducens TaxID=2045209 RepID=A0A2N4UF55_9BURK|nr:DUF2249 domain-containing protein [Pollutimonas nitritireducens]PLC53640.1 hypothetical protein CR155_12570 [Pollutimonas nitritireducens]